MPRSNYSFVLPLFGILLLVSPKSMAFFHPNIVCSRNAITEGMFPSQRLRKLSPLRQEQPLLMSTSKNGGNKKRKRLRRKNPLPSSISSNDDKKTVRVDQQQQKLVVDTSSSAFTITTDEEGEESRFPLGDNLDDEDIVVEFKVQDVRDIILPEKKRENMINSSSTINTVSSFKEDFDNNDEWEYVDFDEEEDNDEYDYVIEEVSDKSYNNTLKRSSNKKSKNKDDAFEQLLVDARVMREEEAEKDKKNAEGIDVVSEDDDNFFLPGLANVQEALPSVLKGDSLRNTLSTIVTADFFLVLALLAWFLFGVFASFILKNDTIQIAFNNNFSLITQPALGILMIGSAASVVWKEEEENADN